MVLRILLHYGIFTNRYVILLLIFLFFLIIHTDKIYYGKVNLVNVFTSNSDWKYTPSKLSEKYISSQINKSNSIMHIQNEDVYGDIKENTVIFVIFVDKFTNHFNLFLNSLSQVRGIEESLVIFSHSYYDEDINKKIRGIDFCRVMQIFYPFSVQTHSQDFPGHHRNDCPTDMDNKTAEALNCTGAYSPDFRGHYRDPVKSERKHHWWWTSNTVFERLNCTQHSGLVVFLEDHFYFMEDFLYIALYMKNVADTLPQCEFLSMAAESVISLNEEIMYGVELTSWDPKVHYGVLAFDAKTWTVIESYYDLYCSFEDSTWYYSLYFISLNRKDGKKFKVISSMLPRAFKIKDCGFYDVFGCTQIKKLMSFQTLNLYWFPSYLELYINIEFEDDIDRVIDYSDIQGGWADPRDKNLCIELTAKKFKKIIMDMASAFEEYRDA